MPFLLVQVYDVVSINEIKNNNICDLQIKYEYQTKNYGFIIFNINKIDKEIIDYFKKNVRTSNVQIIFNKFI